MYEHSDSGIGLLQSVLSTHQLCFNIQIAEAERKPDFAS